MCSQLDQVYKISFKIKTKSTKSIHRNYLKLVNKTTTKPRINSNLENNNIYLKGKKSLLILTHNKLPAHNIFLGDKIIFFYCPKENENKNIKIEKKNRFVEILLCMSSFKIYRFQTTHTSVIKQTKKKQVNYSRKKNTHTHICINKILTIFFSISILPSKYYFDKKKNNKMTHWL